jgi:hypothetical protein
VDLGPATVWDRRTCHRHHRRGKASSSKTDLLSICLLIQTLEKAVQGYVHYSHISVDPG